jgi:hypothetical protein
VSTYPIFSLQFYGQTVADYVAPFISIGKGSDMALSLAEVLYPLKPIVVPAFREYEEAMQIAVLNNTPTSKCPVLPPVCELFNRLTSAIAIIEDIDGVPRQTYFGKSLEIRKESGKLMQHVRRLQRVESLREIDAVTGADEYCSIHCPSTLVSGTEHAVLIFASKSPRVTVMDPAGRSYECTIAASHHGDLPNPNEYLVCEVNVFGFGSGSLFECESLILLVLT